MSVSRSACNRDRRGRSRSSGERLSLQITQYTSRDVQLARPNLPHRAGHCPAAGSGPSSRRSQGRSAALHDRPSPRSASSSATRPPRYSPALLVAWDSCWKGSGGVGRELKSEAGRRDITQVSPVSGRRQWVAPPPRSVSVACMRPSHVC